jgi:hypothetical protein
MKFSLGSVIILGILFSLSACKKKPAPTHSDIYIAGDISKYHKATKQGVPLKTAVYWKNNVMTLLTDSLNDAGATAITVENNDVYVGGRINDTATYWKNGVATKLSAGSIYAIAIVGHDVFMAGCTTTQDYEDIATFWKNGVPTILGPGRIFSMVVKDNDVYMAGVRGYKNENITVYAATYWKNNKKLPLNDTTGGDTQAHSLFLHDGDVYIAGYTDNNSGQYLPVYWKNGRIVGLANPKFIIHEEGAESIFVQNDDVYACGELDNVPLYWKNGVAHTLNNTGANSFATAIAVEGNNLYVGGDNQYYPVYWKNGTRIPLANYKGHVYAMEIVSY